MVVNFGVVELQLRSSENDESSHGIARIARHCQIARASIEPIALV